MKKKKKKKRSVKSTKHRADNIFSELIRRSNLDVDGMCRCITCGCTDVWQNMDAGHYEGRRHNNTRFDKRNVAPQCRVCNRWAEGRKYEFGVYLVKTYGKGIIDELRQAAHVTRRFAVEELDGMINEWKKELQELQ
jgi:hypothetical protein